MRYGTPWYDDTFNLVLDTADKRIKTRQPKAEPNHEPLWIVLVLVLDEKRKMGIYHFVVPTTLYGLTLQYHEKLKQAGYVNFKLSKIIDWRLH